MGKKILKRSLVIGLLMAFVITGNVWADGKIYYLPEGNVENPVTNTAFSKANITVLRKNKRYCGEKADVVKDVLVQTKGDFYINNYTEFWVGVSDVDEGTVSNCTLKINNNMHFDDYVELVAGHIISKSGQRAFDNKIFIENCTLEAGDELVLIAGFSNIVAKNPLVEKNSIIISNAIVRSNLTASVYGNGLSITGGKSYTGDSYGNIVVLKNKSKYYCGDNFEGTNVKIFGGSAGGNAQENKVFIYDGSLDNVEVYGGQADNGDAIDNEVYICDVSINNGEVYGGYSVENGKVKDNILNILGYFKDKERLIKGTASKIGGFSVINYDDLKWNPNGTILKTDDLLLDSNGKVTANINGLSDGSTPKRGEVMTLLDTNTVMLSGDKTFEGQYLEASKSTFNSGNFLKAEGKIYQENEDIKLKITRVGTNDQALVIGESRAAATAFTNQGSELIEIGLDSLARDKSEKETKVFASIFGNASEYATGSHIKVNGWSGIVGVAKTNDDGLTKGAFFENGEGNYRTFNNFEGFLMRGDGEANYNGGGFFVRKDNANGVYTEASLRAGNLQNELRKAVITDSKLEGYDIDTFYYGAHVGVGRIIPRGNEGDSIDVYGKFIYTHHDSEDFAVGGDNFHFDSIDSERLRLGFRINEVQNKKLNMYYGAAWEYEFGGDADNTVVSYDLSTPSLSGSTVIGEIGIHYKASEKWSVDINGRAYTGQRDGFTGSVQANYAF